MTRAISDLVEYVKTTDPDTVYAQYDIEIYEDGSVYDFIDNITYSSVPAWAAVQVDLSRKFEKRVTRS